MSKQQGTYRLKLKDERERRHKYQVGLPADCNIYCGASTFEPTIIWKEWKLLQEKSTLLGLPGWT